MLTRYSIMQYVENRRKREGNSTPIYRIVMLEKPGSEELVYPSGKRSGFPDTGATDEVGYYFSLDDAISAVEENRCDIRETIYDAAFILCSFPGLYQSAGNDARMYFVWDNDGQRYKQSEEPALFRRLAY